MTSFRSSISSIKGIASQIKITDKMKITQDTTKAIDSSLLSRSLRSISNSLQKVVDGLSRTGTQMKKQIIEAPIKSYKKYNAKANSKVDDGKTFIKKTYNIAWSFFKSVKGFILPKQARNICSCFFGAKKSKMMGEEKLTINLKSLNKSQSLKTKLKNNISSTFFERTVGVNLEQLKLLVPEEQKANLENENNLIFVNKNIIKGINFVGEKFNINNGSIKEQIDKLTDATITYLNEGENNSSELEKEIENVRGEINKIYDDDIKTINKKINTLELMKGEINQNLSTVNLTKKEIEDLKKGIQLLEITKNNLLKNLTKDIIVGETKYKIQSEKSELNEVIRQQMEVTQTHEYVKGEILLGLTIASNISPIGISTLTAQVIDHTTNTAMHVTAKLIESLGHSLILDETASVVSDSYETKYQQMTTFDLINIQSNKIRQKAYPEEEIIDLERKLNLSPTSNDQNNNSITNISLESNQEVFSHTSDNGKIDDLNKLEIIKSKIKHQISKLEFSESQQTYNVLRDKKNMVNDLINQIKESLNDKNDIKGRQRQLIKKKFDNKVKNEKKSINKVLKNKDYSEIKKSHVEDEEFISMMDELISYKKGMFSLNNQENRFWDLILHCDDKETCREFYRKNGLD